jgi:hypothetical protein
MRTCRRAASSPRGLRCHRRRERRRGWVAVEVRHGRGAHPSASVGEPGSSEPSARQPPRSTAPRGARPCAGAGKPRSDAPSKKLPPRARCGAACKKRRELGARVVKHRVVRIESRKSKRVGAICPSKSFIVVNTQIGVGNAKYKTLR